MVQHDGNIGADTQSNFAGQAQTKEGMSLGLNWHNTYHFECYDKDGNLKWSEDVTNLVTDAGANDLLTNYFKGSAYTAAWYVGLTGATVYANGDTMASHAGWTEIAAYSNGTRPAWTGGSAAARSISNTASQAIFNINGAATVGGAFLCSNSTISGTTGILYGEAALSSSRTLASGDTLNITVTLSA